METAGAMATILSCKRLRQTAWARLASYVAEWRSARPQRQLRVSETLSLGEKRQLHIVEFGARRLLIGTAGNFLTMLAETQTPHSKAPEGEAGRCH